MEFETHAAHCEVICAFSNSYHSRLGPKFAHHHRTIPKVGLTLVDCLMGERQPQTGNEPDYSPPNSAGTRPSNNSSSHLSNCPASAPSIC